MPLIAIVVPVYKAESCLDERYRRLVASLETAACRGKNLAKYWWSAVCSERFGAGSTEVTSSVSAANVAAINLYASPGFRFRNLVDVYHRLVK